MAPRTVHRLATSLLVTSALAVAAAPAGAQTPLSPLPPAPPETTPTVVEQPTTTSTGGGGLKGWQQTLIFVAGGVLLIGIGWAIVADARQRAPLREGEDPAGHGRNPRHSPEARKRARQRAKAARAARRRNR